MCPLVVVRMETWVKSPGLGRSCGLGNLNVPFLFLGTIFLGWLLQGPKHLPLPAEQLVVAWGFQGGFGAGCHSLSAASASAAVWEFIPTCLGMLPLFTPQEGGKGSPLGLGTRGAQTGVTVARQGRLSGARAREEEAGTTRSSCPDGARGLLWAGPRGDPQESSALRRRAASGRAHRHRLAGLL